jgi:hypothetical protein
MRHNSAQIHIQLLEHTQLYVLTAVNIMTMVFQDVTLYFGK